jgi:cysteine desulfurase/selenocysteine lyase
VAAPREAKGGSVRYAAAPETAMLDIQRIRAQFPITRQRFRVLGEAEPRPLIYMDHGASTHPPSPVLDTYKDFLESSYANVHRGRHYLSEMATDRFEHVSEDILRFIRGSRDGNTVILCGNTTQALDLAAHVMAHRPGVTLVSLMEHHSNDLPHRARGQVVHFGIHPDGTLDYEDLETKLDQHEVKLVAVTGASNVTGYLPDLGRIARAAHARGAKVLVDGAQLLAHAPVDVRPDGDPEHVDLFAGAGHKAYAPFGSSFLFGPRDLLDEAPPYIPAGGTVVYVTEDEAYFKKSPDRHEGGTPNIAGAVALAAALRFLEDAGMDAVREHERQLVEQAMDGLRAVDGVRVLGHPDPARRIGSLSLTIDSVPHELAATVLNREAAIAVRNGCFCAHPYLHRLLGLEDTTELRERLVAGEDVELPGAIRPSFGIFNEEAEVVELLRMVRVIRDRAWKGEYGEIPGAAACKEL